SHGGDALDLRRRQGGKGLGSAVHGLAVPHMDSKARSSTKHQPHVSPGSSERMIGCFVLWKCLVACRFFESSQHPTCPQVMHSLRCTQSSPRARHSSHPSVFGRAWRSILAKWIHSGSACFSS